MSRFKSGPITLVLVCAFTASANAPAQARDSTLLRRTDVVVKIDKDPTALYNGVYKASGISTKCGLADYGFPHRLRSFAVTFPDSAPTGAVTSVNFDADTLARNTTTNSFYLSVGIRVGVRGTPPAYVVRAKEPRYNETGTAQLATSPRGVDTLKVVGVATKGTKVDVEMTLICYP